jgi:hypothetical protein
MNTEQLSLHFTLPEDWIHSILLFLGASLIPFIISTITPITRLFSFFGEARNRQILMARLSQGSYDKETIQQSTQFYISPKCSNIDPAQEEEVRQALMATRENLFDKIDYFIDHGSSKRHLLILADSGTGKTSFVLNYYAYNMRLRKTQNLLLVYLGFKDADDRLRKHENKNETIVFLDALDEDTKAIENHRMRIRELMEICRDFRRVIITCRTQFFPSDEEVPVETGVARLGPRKAGEKGNYEFWKLYLSPFDDSDIDQYLQRRFPIWRLRERRKARALAFQVKSLSARPMLLAHIPDVINSNSKVTQASQLYELMIHAWLERESSWVRKSDLKEYSELLSVNLYTYREQRGMERIPYDELVQLAHDWSIDLTQWQLSGRSLLNRDAQGNYKFAHRSIMEFLFVQRLIKGDSNCGGMILSDQMKSFLFEYFMTEWGEQNLKESFRFLLRMDVSATNVCSLLSNGALFTERKDLSLAAIRPGSDSHTTEIKAFLENLYYTSCFILNILRMFKNELPAIKLEDALQIAQVKLAPESLLAAEFKVWQDSAYVREVLKLVFSIEQGRRIPSTLVKRLGTEIPSVDMLYSQSIDSIGELGELRNLSHPKRVHPDVRRFIKLHGLLGLASVHLISRSSCCYIVPLLPDLCRFDLYFLSGSPR